METPKNPSRHSLIQRELADRIQARIDEAARNAEQAREEESNSDFVDRLVDEFRLTPLKR